MPLQFPSATSDPPRTAYTDTPWEDENGQKWKWQDSALRWIPVIEATGGASTFAELTDKATADLPAINGPLATALDLKADGDHSHTLLDSATPHATADTLVLRDAAGTALFYTGLANRSIRVGNLGLTAEYTPEVGSLSDAVLDMITLPTESRTWSMPNASGTLALTASTTGVPDALAGGTISGTTTVASGTTWNYNSATEKGAHLDALGAGATGKSLLAASTIAASYAELKIQSRQTSEESSVSDNVTFQPVTGLTGFTLDANGIYEVILYGSITAGAAGYRVRLLSSVDLAFNGSSSGISVRANSTASSNDAVSTSTDDLTLLNETAAVTTAAVWSTGCIAVGSTGGTAQIQIRNNATGGQTFTVHSMICVLRKLNP